MNGLYGDEHDITFTVSAYSAYRRATSQTTTEPAPACADFASLRMLYRKANATETSEPDEACAVAAATSLLSFCRFLFAARADGAADSKAERSLLRLQAAPAGAANEACTDVDNLATS